MPKQALALTIDVGEDAFVQPDDYIPERWTTRPNMVLNPDTFQPFSIGESQRPHKLQKGIVITNAFPTLFNLGSNSCPGKVLAMDMTRLVLATLIKKYRWHFAPGETGKNFTSSRIDHFTSSFGELSLSFELREKHTAEI
jgi:tryprostatin B 6-hydroxylase